MPTGSLIINIGPSPKDRDNWKFATKELVARGQAMARMISYAVAKEAFDMLLSEIPDGADYAELKKALKLSEVGGPKKGKEAAYAVYIPTKGRRIKMMDVGKTLIFVTAKRRQGRQIKDVQLLEENGPWTMDTIPFWPKNSEAIIVQRKVSKKETDRVAKEQKAKLPRMVITLRNMGRTIKLNKDGSPGKIKRNAKAIPDLAMLAMSLEFGGNNAKSKPVFRKTFRMVKQSILSLPNKFTQIRDAMTNPKSNKYKTWPKEGAKITMSQVAKFQGFQKRLGF